jgi:hypothetical protein
VTSAAAHETTVACEVGLDELAELAASAFAVHPTISADEFSFHLGSRSGYMFWGMLADDDMIPIGVTVRIEPANTGAVQVRITDEAFALVSTRGHERSFLFRARAVIDMLTVLATR